MHFFRKVFWFLIIVFLLFKFFYIERSANKALYDFDEARYAEVAKNILRTGNFFIPLSGGPDEPRQLSYTKLENGQDIYPFFWKPPLHTWIIAFLYQTIGMSEFTTRFSSLIFSFLNVILVFRITRFLFPTSKKAAYLSAIFFVSSNDFSTILSQGIPDSLFLFFCLLSVFFAFKRGNHSLFISGLAFGGAIMAKSFAAFWVPLLVMLILTLADKRDVFKKMILFLGVAFLTALPWHLLMYHQFGSIFLERYLLTNTLGRTTGTAGNVAPFKWYLIYMLDQWKPYVFIIPVLLPSFLYMLAKKSKAALILAFWMLIILVPYSLAKSKVFWYIFPLWAPLVIFTGGYIDEVFKSNKNAILTILFLTTITSLLPFWQLSLHYIPLKQFFAFFIAVVIISFILSRKKEVSILLTHAVVVLMIIIIANLFSVKAADGRTDWNGDLKLLLSRNKNLQFISVIGMPYEAALFYSNAGNVDNLVTPQTRYIVANKYRVSPSDVINFKLTDKQGEFQLFKRLN